jgi:hypothetical protein
LALALIEYSEVIVSSIIIDFIFGFVLIACSPIV